MMHRGTKPLLILVALIASAPAAQSHPLAVMSTVVVSRTPPAPEALVEQLLGVWDRARAQHHVRSLAKITAEDFTAVTADGTRLTRADVLARGTPERGARMVTSEEIVVHVAGDIAHATARVTSIFGDRARVTTERITLRLLEDSIDGGKHWRIVRSESTLAI